MNMAYEIAHGHIHFEKDLDSTQEVDVLTVVVYIVCSIM